MPIILQKIAVAVLTPILFLANTLGIVDKPVNPTPDINSLIQQSIQLQQDLIAGATIPGVVAKFETSLASGIASTDTSMTLVKGTNSAGNALSGYICFVLDEGTTSEEFVCGTASSTSVTAMLRGIDPIDGDLEVSSLKMTHRRGATVKITDHPAVSTALRLLNGDEYLPNVIRYNTPKSFTASSSLVDKNYVDNSVVAGGVIATESVPGISILGNQSQLRTGTATATYNASTYSLVPQNKYFSATSTATTTVPVTKTGGKLSQGFLDLTEGFTFSGGVTSTGALVQTASSTFASSSFSGGVTFNGTTTTFTNGVAGTFRSAILDMNTTVIVNSPSNNATTTLATSSIPALTLTTSTVLRGKLVFSDAEAAGDGLLMNIFYGGTLISSTTVVTPAGDSTFNHDFDFTIYGIGSASQKTLAKWTAYKNTSAMTAVTALQSITNGSANTAVAGNLIITARWNSVSASDTYTTSAYYLERLYP